MVIPIQMLSTEYRSVIVNRLIVHVFRILGILLEPFQLFLCYTNVMHIK